VRLEQGYPAAQVFAPATDDVICFEPMTAPTNALNSGDRLTLAPRGSATPRPSRSPLSAPDAPPPPRNADGGIGDNRPMAPSSGEVFPDLVLCDHAGNERSLSDLVAGDPTVVQTYRGWWCPKEQAFFRKLVALQDEAEVAYTRIVSISIDPPPVTAAFRAGLGARWTFLCDPDRVAQQQLGLLETTDTVYRPYVPAVFTVFPDLTVHRAYDGYWFWGRPTLEELRQDMRAITRAVRPDWAAPTPPPSIVDSGAERHEGGTP
jgi:peroxiredoxin